MEELKALADMVGFCVASSFSFFYCCHYVSRQHVLLRLYGRTRRSRKMNGDEFAQGVWQPPTAPLSHMLSHTIMKDPVKVVGEGVTELKKSIGESMTADAVLSSAPPILTLWGGGWVEIRVPLCMPVCPSSFNCCHRRCVATSSYWRLAARDNKR